jgi:hypothetical protein
LFGESTALAEILAEETALLTPATRCPTLSEIPDSLFDDQHEPPVDSSEQQQQLPLIVQIGRVLATCVKAQSLASRGIRGEMWKSRVHHRIMEIAQLVIHRIGSQRDNTAAKAKVL